MTLRDYLARLHDAGMAASTAARRLSAMKQFYLFLFSEGTRADNPTTVIDSPKLGRPLPKVLSEAEVTGLLDATRSGGGARRRLWPGARPCGCTVFSNCSMPPDCVFPNWSASGGAP